MLQSLELAVELFRIYLMDESEKANVAAIDAIANAFSAVSGALFYVNSVNEYRFSLSGTLFPIALTKERWHECINDHTKIDAIERFNGWMPPGIDVPVEYWISSPLYASGSGSGFVFLGKNAEPWDEAEISTLRSVTHVIAEIVAIRNKKELESRSRSEAEARLAAIVRRMSTFFDTFRDMIYTIDAAGHFTSVNQAGLRLLGVESESDVIGKTFDDFSDNADVHEFFMQKIRMNGYVSDLEMILKTKAGATVFCLETSHAVFGDDGSIVEIQGHIKDISERIRSEREMWKMNLELAEVNQKLTQTQNLMLQHEKLASIGQLAAGIAHEINNPLGFLKSNQSTLVKYFGVIKDVHERVKALHLREREEIAGAADFDYIFGEIDQIFSENADGFARIVRIISNLMSFSRMRLDEGFEPYDINEGIETTLVVAWNEIKYVAEVSKDLGDIPKIPAHGSEVNQVILNILVNAAQAIAGQNRPEKGHIAITTRLEGAWAVILIADDGPGIPPDIISRIYDPFFTTKEPGKGTGLGLNISWDIIVNKHQGRISVKSEIGSGATFRIELPLVRNDAS